MHTFDVLEFQRIPKPGRGGAAKPRDGEPEHVVDVVVRDLNTRHFRYVRCVFASPIQLDAFAATCPNWALMVTRLRPRNVFSSSF